jgi:hypothetical protein
LTGLGHCHTPFQQNMEENLGRKQSPNSEGSNLKFSVTEILKMCECATLQVANQFFIIPQIPNPQLS